MIKAKCDNGDLVFGLSKENINRLMDGRPIIFNLNKMGLEDRRVMICYGETEEKLYEDMVDNMTLQTKINEE